ncbi:hypothetical protein [Peribacillus asahii]|uniref:hypothetical protein n=1 Tax=Peribacillus asahii TaxID=228899 RepID=UPI002079B5CA|nr:hypothetical protein [Peribacillus asahii]USK59764.1 hypothetical protein LIT37_21920 [Peribacillus asahii]
MIEVTFRERKEEHKRKRAAKKKSNESSWWDILMEVLFSVPELLLWPFRLVWWGIRGLIKWIW